MTSEGKVQVQQDGYNDPNVAHAVAPKRGFQLPAGYQDIIHTKTEIRFSWRDRIRILFSGVCWVNIDTYTENLPGKVESKSIVICKKPSFHNIKLGNFFSRTRIEGKVQWRWYHPKLHNDVDRWYFTWELWFRRPKWENLEKRFPGFTEARKADISRWKSLTPFYIRWFKKFVFYNR